MPRPAPTNAKEFAQRVNEPGVLADSGMIYLNTIDRSPALKPNLKSLDAGIKRFHSFTFPDHEAKAVQCKTTTRNAMGFPWVQPFVLKKGSRRADDSDDEQDDA